MASCVCIFVWKAATQFLLTTDQPSLGIRLLLLIFSSMDEENQLQSMESERSEKSPFPSHWQTKMNKFMSWTFLYHLRSILSLRLSQKAGAWRIGQAKEETKIFIGTSTDSVMAWVENVLFLIYRFLLYFCHWKRYIGMRDDRGWGDGLKEMNIINLISRMINWFN